MAKWPTRPEVESWVVIVGGILAIFTTISSVASSFLVPYGIFTKTQLIRFLLILSLLFIIIFTFFLIVVYKEFIKKNLKYVMILFSLLLICLFSVYYFNQTAIVIKEPNAGDLVESNIDVMGIAKNVPGEETIWLVVVSPTGRFYPYIPLITPDIQTGDWQLRDVQIGTPMDKGKSFYLITATADANSKSDLDNYFKKAAQLGSWGGLERLPPGMNVYDKVKITRIKDPNQFKG